MLGQFFVFFMNFQPIFKKITLQIFLSDIALENPEKIHRNDDVINGYAKAIFAFFMNFLTYLS